MVWGYECLKLSKEYPRVGVNAQLLKIILAGCCLSLAWHEAHQLLWAAFCRCSSWLCPFPWSPLALSGHGLGPLCGCLSPTALPIHHHRTVCHQCGHLFTTCNLLATLPTPPWLPDSSNCASNVVGNCICASISIAKVCGGIHLNKLYQLVWGFGAYWVLIWPLSCYPTASSWESGRLEILAHSSVSETIMFPVFFHGILSGKYFMIISLGSI